MISDHLNPILVKDVRSRMRGGRAFLILTIFLLLAGMVSYLTYLSVSSASRYDIAFVLSGTIGKSIFYALMTATQILLMLTAPLLTIGAISGEVERKTYDMLLATPLTASQIVLGKLGGAGAFSLLLIFGVLPLLGIAYFFGGWYLTGIYCCDDVYIASSL
jgi:ABC-2 type transport system permease protein